jgi:hypothetical protein
MTPDVRELVENHQLFSTMIQEINVPEGMDRAEIHELGRRRPYRRFVEFPVNITEELCEEKND